MLSINEKSHRELYYDYRKCLDFLRTIPPAKISEHVPFHMHWKTVRPFGRKQILPIKSYLATQDLEHTSLTLWSNADLTSNDLLKPFLPYIKFKIFNPLKESKGTGLESSALLKVNDPQVYADGDLFRTLILHVHGGIYVDMDVVLLRDLSPLLDQEFLYKWGTTDGINGAVMRLFSRSAMSNELINCILTIPAGGTNWGCHSYVRAIKHIPNFTVLPSAFFDMAFLLGDETFKTSPTSSQLYDGTFAWHWHNRWDEPIEKGCKFEYMEQLIHKQLSDKLHITI